jgi:hypothetical protein
VPTTHHPVVFCVCLVNFGRTEIAATVRITRIQALLELRVVPTAPVHSPRIQEVRHVSVRRDTQPRQMITVHFVKLGNSRMWLEMVIVHFVLSVRIWMVLVPLLVCLVLLMHILLCRHWLIQGVPVMPARPGTGACACCAARASTRA